MRLTKNACLQYRMHATGARLQFVTSNEPRVLIPRSCHALALSFVLLISPAALAQPNVGSASDVEDSREATDRVIAARELACAPAEDLALEIARRTRNAPRPGFVLRISQAGTRVRLNMRFAGGERTLTVATCAEAYASAATLVVVAMFGPEAANDTSNIDVPTESEPAPAAARAPAFALRAEEVVRIASATLLDRARNRNPSRPTDDLVFAAFGGAAHLGLVPTPALEFGALALLRHDGFRAGVGLTVVLPQTSRADGAAVSISLWHATLSAGGIWPLVADILFFAPRIGVEVGLVSGSGVAVLQPRTSQYLWLAGCLTADIVLNIGPIQAALIPHLVLPFVPASFVLDDNSTLFAPSTLGGGATLMLGGRFVL